MANYPLPPYDLIEASVNSNTVGAADCVLAAQGKITLAGLGTPVVIRNIISYTKTTGVAETLQVTTIDTTAATVVVGTPQRFKLQRLSDNQVFQFDVVPATTSVVTLKAAIVTGLNAILGSTGAAIVTAVSTGANTLTITEVTGTGAFLFFSQDSGTTVVYTTSHVNSSGSLAEVQQYDKNASGTLFTKYDFYVSYRIVEQGSNANVVRYGHLIYWVEQNDAQFAAFNTKLDTNTVKGGGITAAADVIPYVAGA